MDDHITDKAVTADATEKRFPGGRCLCTPQDPCPCSGQLVRYCPCYRDEAARLDATASKVVVPTTPGPIPGVSPTAKAKLDAIEVDLRGGYVRSGEHIAEDPDEYRDEQFVNVADLPSIIHAWASAALPVLDTTKDAEIAELKAIAGRLVDERDEMQRTITRQMRRIGEHKEEIASLTKRVDAVLHLHAPIDVHDMEAGGEPPPVAERSCRACSDEDYVSALDNGERVAIGDGVRWPCATVNAIATSLGVSGEDRSEPTTATRTCPEKGINHDTRAVLDCELPAGHDGWHQAGDSFWRVGAPAHVLAAAKPEVVTPEVPA